MLPLKLLSLSTPLKISDWFISIR
ncbi:hypothetical protein METHPM2_380013 [Pseudomonas sp. PM2]